LLTICVLGLVGLACINYALIPSVLNPTVLFALIWAFQAAGLLAFQSLFLAPSAETLLLVLLGCLMFSIGGNAAYLAASRARYPWKEREVRDVSSVFFVAAIAVAASVVGHLHVFFGLLDEAPLAERLVYARTLISSENQDIYGIYKYGSSISLAAMLALQISILRGRASLSRVLAFVYFTLTSLVLAFFSTGRGPIAFVFMLLGIAYTIQASGGGFVRRLLVILVSVLAATFMIFWLIGEMMGKTEGAATGALNSLVAYVFSGVPALSVYLDAHTLMPLGGNFGTNTFRFFFALAAALGITEAPPSLVQEDVFVPHPTNLYTAYFHYLTDFGYIGFCLPVLAIGLFHGYIFRCFRERRGDELMRYIFVMSFLPLAQTVFQETHFTLLSTWLQLGLMGAAFTKACIHA
jgi:oligosaccharide repeat unit polymerase